MDKRSERQLEEILKLPGNDTCADCHAPAPRWASVNLGIFLCVGCASVHRKLGTHKSRVKSVTLDTWSREQITHIRSIGNKAANSIWNPNETLHPPPTSTVHDERDSEIERYIRKKYELGAFRARASTNTSGRTAVEPTSLNRARERDGRLPPGSTSGLGRENQRNPELNDIVSKRETKERDLPPLPFGQGASSNNGPSAAPRPRPTRSPSNNNLTTVGPIWNKPSSSSSAPVSTVNKGGGTREANLIDFSDTTRSNATLPLQINMGNAQNIPHAGAGPGSWNANAAGAMAGPSPMPQGQFLTPQAQVGSWTASPSFSTSPAFSTSPSLAQNAYLGTSPQFGISPNINAGMYNASHLSPQPTYQQLSPQSVYGQHLSPQPTFAGGGQMSPQPTFQNPSPTFVQQSFQPQQPFLQQQQQQGQGQYGVAGYGQAMGQYQNPVMSGGQGMNGGYGYGQQWRG